MSDRSADDPAEKSMKTASSEWRCARCEGATDLDHTPRCALRSDKATCTCRYGSIGNEHTTRYGHIADGCAVHDPRIAKPVTSEDPPECNVKPFMSRPCDRGTAGCVVFHGVAGTTIERVSAEATKRTPRFFIDHGMLHDRVTGKHVTTNEDSPYEDGIVACCALLNALADDAKDATELLARGFELFGEDRRERAIPHAAIGAGGGDESEPREAAHVPEWALIAWLLDRREQYKPSSGTYAAFDELIGLAAERGHVAAWKHGEIDDLKPWAEKILAKRATRRAKEGP